MTGLSPFEAHEQRRQRESRKQYATRLALYAALILLTTAFWLIVLLVAIAL